MMSGVNPQSEKVVPFDVDFIQGEKCKSFELLEWKITKKTLSPHFPRVEGLEYKKGSKCYGLEADGDEMKLREGITEYYVISSNEELGTKQKFTDKQKHEVTRVVGIYTGSNKSEDREEEMKKSSEKIGKKPGKRQVRVGKKGKKAKKGGSDDEEEIKSKIIKVTWFHRNEVEGKGLFHKQGLPDGGEKDVEFLEDEDYSHDDVKKKLILAFYTPRTRGYMEESFIMLDSNSDKVLDKHFFEGDPKGFWKFYKTVMHDKKRFNLCLKTTFLTGYQDRIVMDIIEERKKQGLKLWTAEPKSEVPSHNFGSCRDIDGGTPGQYRKLGVQTSANIILNDLKINPSESPKAVKTPVDGSLLKGTVPMEHSSSPIGSEPHHDNDKYIDLTVNSNFEFNNYEPIHEMPLDQFDSMIVHTNFHDRVQKVSLIEQPILAKPNHPESLPGKVKNDATHLNSPPKTVSSTVSDHENIVTQPKVFKEPAPPPKKLRLSDIARVEVQLGQEIPYADLKFIKSLGSGSGGTVSKGEWNMTDVAIKEISILNTRPKMILKEVQALRDLNHPNSVQLLGVSHEKHKYFIVMEYVNGHDLHTILFELDLPLNEDFIMKQLFTVLAYLHNHPKKFVHCDIKPLNILIDSHQRLKLCDLGLAKIRNIAAKNMMQTSVGGSFRFVGTPMYMAPEVALHISEPDEASDMWSAGLTACETYNREDGWKLDEDDPIGDLLQKCKNKEKPNIGKVPDFVKDGIKKCFIYNTKDASQPLRITSRELALCYRNVKDV